MSDYLEFRGKCKEASEAFVVEHPEYRLVRGYYFCPFWNSEEAHWWTVSPLGEIHDPTKLQFPSKGFGIYREFDGAVECSQCGKAGDEKSFTPYGNYIFCSGECAMQFVGL